jgi:hypothetical protein
MRAGGKTLHLAPFNNSNVFAYYYVSALRVDECSGLNVECSPLIVVNNTNADFPFLSVWTKDKEFVDGNVIRPSKKRVLCIFTGDLRTLKV